MEIPLEFRTRKATVAEVARFLGVSHQWVYDQKALGRIPFDKQGKYLRFDLFEVEEYYRQRGFHPTPPDATVHRLNGRKRVTRNG